MRGLLILFRSLLGMGLLALLLAAAGAMYVYATYGGNVPETDELAEYAPPMVTRVHATDGRMMAEYAIENRVFVPIDEVPKRVIDAFLAAEDKSFYTHWGIDPVGVVRGTRRWR